MHFLTFSWTFFVLVPYLEGVREGHDHLSS
jgi:hypothetical protein